MSEATSPREGEAVLSPRDPRHPKMFEIDGDYVTIYWGGYAYDIALDRMNTPEKVLQWVLLLSGKAWEHTTPKRIALLIQTVAGATGFNPWGPV